MKTVKRTEQVNVRLTKVEKALLLGYARKHGYRGLSDCLRVIVLAKIKGGRNG
jgi:hypothetical protein